MVFKYEYYIRCGKKRSDLDGEDFTHVSTERK